VAATTAGVVTLSGCDDPFPAEKGMLESESQRGVMDDVMDDPDYVRGMEIRELSGAETAERVALAAHEVVTSPDSPIAEVLLQQFDQTSNPDHSLALRYETDEKTYEIVVSHTVVKGVNSDGGLPTSFELQVGDEETDRRVEIKRYGSSGMFEGFILADMNYDALRTNSIGAFPEVDFYSKVDVMLTGDEFPSTIEATSGVQQANFTTGRNNIRRTGSSAVMRRNGNEYPFDAIATDRTVAEIADAASEFVDGTYQDLMHANAAQITME